METKKCTRCGRELPIEMFNKSNRAKDGHQSWCKSCTKEFQAKQKEANKEAKKAVQHAANLAGPDANRITTADGKTYRKVTAEPVCKELKDYTGTEIFAELKRRGYKWANDAIYKKMYVNYDKIEI